MPEDRLARLARAIDDLAAKDEEILRRTIEIEALRRQAAVELHGLCAAFVEQVNALVSKVRIELAPADFDTASFRDPGPNLFQINAKGRVIQLEFHATDALTSTENFRSPYTIEGAVRCFNQDLLDRVDVQENSLFFCPDGRPGWRYFDRRTQRGGAVDREYLIGLLEKLV